MSAPRPAGWQAAASLLERKHTDEFGRRERLAIEGTKDGAPVQVQAGGVIVLPPLGEGSR